MLFASTIMQLYVRLITGLSICPFSSFTSFTSYSNSTQRKFIMDINTPNFAFGGLLFFASLHMAVYRQLCKPAIAYFSKVENSPYAERVKKIVANCKKLTKNFYPPLFFYNCHLQLLPFMIQNMIIESILPKFTWISELVEMQDGEIVLVEWAERQPTNSPDETTPVLIINHGATGHTRDQPGQTYVQSALAKGWFVCVFNRRGHGGRTLSRPNFNFFGSTDDLRTVIATCIRGKMPNAKVFIIGLSAGSGLVARYMGEQGMELSDDDSSSSSSSSANYSKGITFCNGAVGVNPGYNIEKCMANFGPPYSSYVLSSVKNFFQEKNREILKNCPGFEDSLNAKNLQEWLDHSYGMAGFESKLAYYDATNPMRVAKYIKHPTLMINSKDDPLCVMSNAYEGMHIFENNTAPGACVIETATGTHCSFLEIGLMSSYTNSVAFEFFDSVLKIQ